MNNYTIPALSDEQLEFINKAREGKNILVDACIGSGKTTAIQQLCNVLPNNPQILYLTYNKLLKIDAQSKIKNKNVKVTNYHGFAYQALLRMGIRAGLSDIIQRYNQEKPYASGYDILILDEYQDIEEELAAMLEHIKSENPNLQIIAVGDMKQKIYDKTTLRVPEFIDRFLGDYVRITFSRCFRLSSELASKLGKVWNKNILGVNNNCIVEKMSMECAEEFLSKQKPSDILCLGSRKGPLATMLNNLERDFPDRFNKNTVFASISDRDATGATSPKSDSAIFTTYDSSKGLERNVCVIFDFTESYWEVRIQKPQQSYEILRNIFCVAASRGKEHIIFIDNGEAQLSERTLATPQNIDKPFEDFSISDMFDFKFKEDIEKCYSLLAIKSVESMESSIIDIPNSDGLIDISPCIGIYQEAVFFRDYVIDADIKFFLELHPDQKRNKQPGCNETLDDKILYLTSLETQQERYCTQVETPIVTEEQKCAITDRLSTIFSTDETVQVGCALHFSDLNCSKKLFSAIGLADVVKNETVYELKFARELTHEHFLQCACYVIALGLSKGILWNTCNNTMYEIGIPDRLRFLDAVITAITKGAYKNYFPLKAEV